MYVYIYEYQVFLLTRLFLLFFFINHILYCVEHKYCTDHFLVIDVLFVVGETK